MFGDLINEELIKVGVPEQDQLSIDRPATASLSPHSHITRVVQGID